MNIRTLSKEDTIHVVNLSCLVLAWGVSCYYFDAEASNKAVASLGNVLLSPFYFVNQFTFSIAHVRLAENPVLVFLILWMTYFILGTRLSSLLMVKDHEVSELKSWYFTRKKSSVI